jgi:GntR family phosphonate transport system transcriptional regulator
MTARPPKPTAAAEATTAWRRIADEIAAEIAYGTYAVGAALPPTVELATRFGVHRHTVRQAYHHLAELGLVSVEQGRGTFVTERRFPYRLGRRVRMRTNFGAASTRITGRIVEIGRTAASSEVAAALALEHGAEVWHATTLSLAAGVPVSFGLHHVAVHHFPDFRRDLELAKGSITGAMSAAGAGDYVRLSTRLVARMPSAEEKAQLSLAGDEPVLQSTGLDGRPDGTPLHLVVAAFAGSRTQMIVGGDDE